MKPSISSSLASFSPSHLTPSCMCEKFMSVSTDDDFFFFAGRVMTKHRRRHLRHLIFIRTSSSAHSAAIKNMKHIHCQDSCTHEETHPVTTRIIGTHTHSTPFPQLGLIIVCFTIKVILKCLDAKRVESDNMVIKFSERSKNCKGLKIWVQMATTITSYCPSSFSFILHEAGICNHNFLL